VNVESLLFQSREAFQRATPPLHHIQRPLRCLRAVRQMRTVQKAVMATAIAAAAITSRRAMPRSALDGGASGGAGADRA